MDYVGKIDKACLENERISAALLPQLGGKLISLKDKRSGFEFLFQNPKGEYKLRGAYDSFENYDASGFDDAFPNINESVSRVSGKDVHFPDHGEIWRTQMTADNDGHGIVLACRGKVLPYLYQKKVSLMQTGLHLEYRIVNEGTFDIPCLWTMHDLVNYDRDMCLILPKSPDMVENVLSCAAYGNVGNKLPVNSAITHMPDQADCDMLKWYLCGKVDTGVCGYEYPSRGLRLMLKYDANKLPYLGFWCTLGGYRGDFNAALEPSTGYYDGIDIARAHNALPIIAPGDSFEFSIEMTIEHI